MLATFDDTDIRESFINIAGIYFYLLLICGSIVSGEDPIIRECSAYPTKIRARAINSVFLLPIRNGFLHNTTVTFLVAAVAWLISGFAASNTTNKHTVGTFHGVESVTVNGGTFITNLGDKAAQVQSSRPRARTGLVQR